MKKLVLSISIAMAMAASATQYSKLAIITACKSSGCWDQLKSAIQQSGYHDEWLVCQFISDEYAQFPAVTNMIVSSGIATDEQVKSILAAAVDTSVPDKVMTQRYERETKTESGRIQWHGKLVRQIVNTNDFTRTTVFEDGSVYVDPWETKDIRAIVQEVNRKLPIQPTTNGIPVALARARIKAYQDRQAVSNVTHEVTVGK